jgi:hypothetical protein
MLGFDLTADGGHGFATTCNVASQRCSVWKFTKGEASA